MQTITKHPNTAHAHYRMAQYNSDTHYHVHDFKGQGYKYFAITLTKLNNNKKMELVNLIVNTGKTKTKTNKQTNKTNKTYNALYFHMATNKDYIFLQ